jgi:NACalpha-BTF3-like transcription factor
LDELRKIVLEDAQTSRDAALRALQAALGGGDIAPGVSRDEVIALLEQSVERSNAIIAMLSPTEPE